MRTKNFDWFDANTHTVVYGFQIYANKKWCFPLVDGAPCIYTNEKERDEKRKEFRRLKDETQKTLYKPNQEAIPEVWSRP